MNRRSSWAASAIFLLGCGSQASAPSSPAVSATPSSSSVSSPGAEPTGRAVLVEQFPTKNRSRRTAALSPDGRFVALAGSGETLLVDTRGTPSAGVVGTLPGCASSVAFTDDGKHLFIVDCDHKSEGRKLTATSRVWDLEHDATTTVAPEVEHNDPHSSTRGADLLHWGQGTLSLVHGDTHESVNLRSNGESFDAAALAKDGTVVTWSDSGKLATRSSTGESLGGVQLPFKGTGVFADGADRLLVHAGRHVAIVDTARGEVLREADFCEDRVSRAKFTSDGKRVIVACAEDGQRNAKLELTSLELGAPIVTRPIHAASTLDARGGVIALTGDGGTTILDESTLDVLVHLDESRASAVISANGKRVLVSAPFAVIDVEQRKVTWSLAPARRSMSLTQHGSGRVGFSLRRDDGDADEPGFLDVATGRVVTGVALSESGSGAYVPSKAAESLEIVDPTTLARSKIPAPFSKPYTWKASPAGAHLVTSGFVNEEGSRIAAAVVGADGRDRRFPLLASNAPFVLDDADKLAASVQVSPNGTGGSIRIDRLDDPSASSSFPVGTLTNGSTLYFSPDAQYLVVDGDVYELSTPRKAWRGAPHEVIHFLGAKPIVLAEGEQDTRVLDRASGKQLRVIEHAFVRGGSDDGEYVVMATNGKDLVLVDTATFEHEVKLPFPWDASRVWVAPGGAFVWSGQDEGLVGYRVADGRRLIFLGGKGPITDENVFDPADIDALPLRVRHGVNLLEAKLEPPSASSAFAHPHLFADFVAGKTVSPVR
ncbi:MAG: hypothetical protein U0414_19625 [Polyangiaceae bacterium]